jgi:hypothetical protein
LSGSVSLVSVRRLAAIDMHGGSGSARRRRIILAEFIIGVIGMGGFGVWVSTNASDISSRMLGPCLVCAGLNGALLAVYAVILSRRGALEAELATTDARSVLRRYGVLQLWIFVPVSLIAVELYALVRDQKHR